MSVFGTNLRNLRLSRGLTQEEMAELINSNQASITAWERGVRMPPLLTIQGIADSLHVPLSTLIGVQMTGYEADADRELIDLLESNPKIRDLLSRARFLSDQDLDVLLSVARSMTKDAFQK